VSKRNKIAVIGYPSVGKSTITYRMEASPLFKNHSVFHMDKIHYKTFGDLVTKGIADLIRMLHGKRKWIIEGVQCFWFLRKVAMNYENDLFPDLILNVSKRKYNPEPRHERFIKTINTIWKQFDEICERDSLKFEFLNYRR